MIDHVERLVLNNRRIKVAELASECGISGGYTLIHKHLGMSMVSARWVPGNLNMQDRQQRVESSQKSSGSVQCQSRRLSHSSCNRR